MENITRYKCQMSGCPIVSAIEAPVCEEHLEQIGRIYLETRSVDGSFMQLREAMRQDFKRALYADRDPKLLLAMEPGGWRRRVVAGKRHR